VEIGRLLLSNTTFTFLSQKSKERKASQRRRPLCQSHENPERRSMNSHHHHHHRGRALQASAEWAFNNNK